MKTKLKVGDRVTVITSDGIEVGSGFLTKKKGSVCHVDDGAVAFSEKVIESTVDTRDIFVHLTCKASDAF